MGKELEVWRVMETESSHLDKIIPAEIIARQGTITGAGLVGHANLLCMCGDERRVV